MINQTTLKQRSQLHQNNTQAASTEKERAALSCEVKQLLAGLEKGDQVKGQLIQTELNGLLLKLMNGMTLPVSLKEQAPLQTLLDFIVITSQAEQIILKPCKQDTSQPLTEKILDTLNLPKTEEMTQCVEQFIEDERVLDKGELLKHYHLSKTFKLPIPMLMQLGDRLGIEKDKFFNQLQTTLKVPLEQHVETLKQVIFEDSHLTPLQQLKNSVTIFENYHHHLPENEALPREIKAFIVEYLNGEQAGLNQIQGDLSYPKVGNANVRMDQQLWQELLKHLKVSDADRLPVYLEKALINFAKQIYDKQFSLAIKDIEQMKESFKESKFCKVSETLLKLAETQEQVDYSTKGKAIVQEVKESLQVWGKLNQVGEYYQYPLVIHEQKQEVEIYFYKPKKKNKGKSNSFYAVVSLDFPAIKHIEVHIHQIDEGIRVMFEVEDEGIKQYLNGCVPGWIEKIKGKGYNIQQYQCCLKHTQQPTIEAETVKWVERSIDMKV